MTKSAVALFALLVFLSFSIISIQAGNSFEVQITNSGFKPNSLIINRGDQIKFKNVDSNPHWPASNIHPTHQIYPEFDPKAEIAPSKDWSFTFNRVGTWKFHDHLFPERIGQIKVNGSSDWFHLDPKSIFSSLKDLISLKLALVYYQLFPEKLNQDLAKVNFIKQAGDEALIKHWLQIIGGDKVMDKLLADSNGGSSIDCHQEAHLIGRLAYQVFKSNVFHKGSSGCHSGYYHGAMEAFLNDKGTDNLAVKINELCSKFPTSFTKFECLHGVGHGILAYLDYNLPWSLKTCQLLDSDFSKSSCYGGVFMENIVTAEGKGAARDAHQTKWVSKDPLFPCNGIDQAMTVQYQCYLMQTSRMLDISNHNFDFAAKTCLTVKDSFKGTCFQSLGRDIAGFVLRDPHKIIDFCSKVESNYYYKCIEGSLYVVIDFWGDKLTSQAAELCQLVQNYEQRQLCFQQLGGRLKELFADIRPHAQICLDNKDCLKAAGIL